MISVFSRYSAIITTDKIPQYMRQKAFMLEIYLLLPPPARQYLFHLNDLIPCYPRSFEYHRDTLFTGSVPLAYPPAVLFATISPYPNSRSFLRQLSIGFFHLLQGLFRLAVKCQEFRHGITSFILPIIRRGGLPLSL